MNDYPDELHVYLRRLHPGEITSLSLLAALIPAGSEVLDLGCGSGALGETLTKRGCVCDGLTLNAAEAAHARSHYRHLEVADLELANLRQLFEGRKYDAIVCADVLEHLRRPDRLVDQCRDLLREEGNLLVSVPNAAYAGLVLELLHGEFRYREEGLLDRTHLRFFTRSSLTSFLTDNRWETSSIQAVHRDLSDSEFPITPDSLPPAVSRYVLAQPDALTYQFVVSARPRPAATPSLPLAEPRAARRAIFTAQLYWSDQDAYDEGRKLTAAGEIGTPRQTLCFLLPTHEATSPRLRFDPADRPGFMHLHALRLLDAAGDMAWQWRPGDIRADELLKQPHNQISWAPPTATSPDTALLLLTGDDPWVELPIPAEVLARSMACGESRLEVDLGWPMSADYIALSANIRAGQMQAAHTEANLAISLREHRLVQAELHKVTPLAQASVLLQEQNHHLTHQIDALRAHVNALENSRIFRITRPAARLRRRLAELVKPDRPTEHAEVAPEAISTAHAGTTGPDETWHVDIDSQPQTVGQRANAADQAAAVDIIIPVFKGLEDTRCCVESVLKSVHRTPTRVIVINDASPDLELTQWLRTLAAQEPAVVLIENPSNLGFVRTVNIGMALDPSNDVVLLNSDTEVARDWVDRLRSAVYSAPHVGTATPLSNNATICSYPRFCESNALPDGYDTAALDALCESTNSGITVDIPTAVGFCMYIRRDCLTQVGVFDAESFGLGYGEENDFCMRAAAAGWRHVLAADTFVRHAGGISFGESKTKREAEAQSILQRLHPTYEAIVRTHIANDPARACREAIDIARLKSGVLPKILAVMHGIGGGTRRHVHELRKHLQAQAIFLTLTPMADHWLRLEWDAPGEAFTKDFHWLQQADELVVFLRGLGIGHIHYHHLLGLNPSLMNLPEQLGVTYDFTTHDYYTACPQIAMVDASFSYCGEAGHEQCRRCVEDRPSPTGESIEDWRLRHRLFLNGARAVLAPSRDTAKRISRYFPAANVRHAPHLDIPPDVELPRPTLRTIHPDSNLRVFVIGALSRIKGSDTLEAASLEAARRNLPLEFHLLGYPHVPLKQQPHASLTVHGAYEDDELQSLLNRLKPDLIWFPARWPETYSYTLSACLDSGCPVLAPDLGAFPERLARRPWSWIYPWSLPSGDCVRLLLELREQYFLSARQPTQAPGCTIPLPDDTLSRWSYERDYLPTVAAPAAQ
ncbi:MAG: methyltransferase domain-containing protein [Acidovorax sp.]|uniref:methyltransferase domain-containing protein n=1 Tax=Acidovorax sp. TaxID=1872122 RepID=UPI002603C960|nr:methyltransferase domain-containing protein [Acidovorax sp.]MDH4426155.1 methyltransferase domain-containing protein [Acidovorax sp.]